LEKRAGERGVRGALEWDYKLAAEGWDILEASDSMNIELRS
jgi:hypothetical protein